MFLFNNNFNISLLTLSNFYIEQDSYTHTANFKKGAEISEK
jgi:hypothetical protein